MNLLKRNKTDIILHSMNKNNYNINNNNNNNNTFVSNSSDNYNNRNNYYYPNYNYSNDTMHHIQINRHNNNIGKNRENQENNINGKEIEREKWVNRVKNHQMYKNPKGLSMMCDAFGINEYDSCLLSYKKIILFKKNMSNIFDYKQVALRQNKECAKWCVKEGIETKNKENPSNEDYQNALNWFKHALNIDPNCNQATIETNKLLSYLNEINYFG